MSLGDIILKTEEQKSERPEEESVLIDKLDVSSDVLNPENFEPLQEDKLIKVKVG